MSRVRGRSRSSSADSDGTPEKIITGTSAGVATTTSRPDPAAQPQIDDRRHQPVLAQRVEPFVGRFRGDDREAVHLEELHQRSADRDVVFDHQHQARAVFAHKITSVFPTCRPDQYNVKGVSRRARLTDRVSPHEIVRGARDDVGGGQQGGAGFRFLKGGAFFPPPFPQVEKHLFF